MAKPMTAPGRPAREARPLALPPPAAGALFVVAALVMAATAQAGLWFAPFVAGVAAGLASLRWRRAVLVVAAGAVLGWGLPLWILALRGLPAGATARAIAAFAGLPAHAVVAIVATLLLAALQVFVAAWLARSLARVRPPRGSS